MKLPKHNIKSGMKNTVYKSYTMAALVEAGMGAALRTRSAGRSGAARRPRNSNRMTRERGE